MQELGQGSEVGDAHDEPLLHADPQLTPPSKIYGLWRKSLYPLGAYCCCQVAFQGVFTSLVLYLKRVRDEDNATAAATVSAVLGSGFCTSFFVAFLADGYLGRRWTSVLILTVFFVGCSFLSIITELQLKTQVFFTLSLYLAGLGYGWFKPSLAALGGDQFNSPKDRTTFYNHLFVAGTIGEIFSLTVVIYIENAGHWALGYWICTGAIAIGVLFLVGMRVNYLVRDNPFKTISHVLVAATRKWNVHVPADPAALFEPEEELGQLVHTHRFQFLDKAATMPKEDVDGLSAWKNPWRLCSVQQVEEVKSLLNVLPLWAVLLCKAAATSQLTSLFVEQGDAMNSMVGSFEVAPASMTLFNMLARIVIAVVFDVHIRRGRLTSRRPSSAAFLQIGIAYIAACISMVVAAIVETVRLSRVHHGVSMSILWLLPQYVFEGVALVCGVVGEADLFYNAAAPGIRSLSSSLPVLYRGLGSYISALLVTLITLATTEHGQSGWIAADLNEGHLNYFFLLLAGIIMLSFLVFVTMARRFSYPIIQGQEVSMS